MNEEKRRWEKEEKQQNWNEYEGRQMVKKKEQ